MDEDIFIYWNGGFTDNVIYPFVLSPPSIFGFHMLKIDQCIPTYGAGSPTLIGLKCSKDSEIILCFARQSCPESLQRPVRYVYCWVFLSVLRCSYFKLVDGHRLEIRIVVAIKISTRKWNMDPGLGKFAVATLRLKVGPPAKKSAPVPPSPVPAEWCCIISRMSLSSCKSP